MQLFAKQARLQVSSRGRVLSVEVSGLVTARTIEEIRVLVAPMLPLVGAAWFDYTRSAIAVTDLELQGLVAPITSGMKSTPMAWAVSDEGTEALWSRQSLRLALHGHRRFVGGGVDAAAAWAEQQAKMAPAPAAR